MVWGFTISGCKCQNIKQDIEVISKSNGYKIIGDGNYYIVHSDSKMIFGTDTVTIPIVLYNGGEQRKEIESLLLEKN
jgi:hypothetical protein